MNWREQFWVYILQKKSYEINTTSQLYFDDTYTWPNKCFLLSRYIWWRNYSSKRVHYIQSLILISLDLKPYILSSLQNANLNFVVGRSSYKWFLVSNLATWYFHQILQKVMKTMNNILWMWLCVLFFKGFWFISNVLKLYVYINWTALFKKKKLITCTLVFRSIYFTNYKHQLKNPSSGLYFAFCFTIYIIYFDIQNSDIIILV